MGCAILRPGTRDDHSPIGALELRWWPIRTGHARALFTAGASWALLFAAAHVYWAAGGRVGVPSDAGDIHDRPGFLAYDLASAAVFLAAAAAGVLLARGDTRPWLLRLTAAGSILALLRGFGALIQDLVTGTLSSGVAYDAWFAIAELVFATAVRSAQYDRAT